MSLLNTTSGPLQTKLFEPGVWQVQKYSRQLQEELAALTRSPQLLALLAYMHQNRLRVLLSVGGFFCIALGAFAFSVAKVSPASAAEPTKSAATAGVRPLEMHIAANGLALLRSARVVSLNGTSLTLATSWGSVDFIWVVHTNASRYESRSFGTKFISRDGTKSSFSEIRLGNLVTVTGMLDSNAQEPTINADSVRILQ